MSFSPILCFPSRWWLWLPHCHPRLFGNTSVGTPWSLTRNSCRRDGVKSCGASARALETPGRQTHISWFLETERGCIDEFNEIRVRIRKKELNLWIDCMNSLSQRLIEMLTTENPILPSAVATATAKFAPRRRLCNQVKTKRLKKTPQIGYNYTYTTYNLQVTPQLWVLHVFCNMSLAFTGRFGP